MKEEESPSIDDYLVNLLDYSKAFNSQGRASQIKLFKDHSFETVEPKKLKNELIQLKDIISDENLWKHVDTGKRGIFIEGQITSLIRTSPETFNGSLVMMDF